MYQLSMLCFFLSFLMGFFLVCTAEPESWDMVIGTVILGLNVGLMLRFA